MAAPLTTDALAESYRVGQAKVASEAAAQLTLAFRTLLNPGNLDKTFPVYVTAASRILDEARRKTAGLGGAFYLAHRQASGVLGALPEIAWAGSLPPAQVATSLLVTGPVAVKRAIRMGATVPQALASAEVKAAGMAYRHAADGGRATIQGSVYRDKKALGWARLSDGRPCYFCAMLASRGPVYKSATTAGLRDGVAKYHDKCGCFVVPVYDMADPWPGIGPQLQDLWTEATAGKSGPEAVQAFRKAYDAKHPIGTNPSEAIAHAQEEAVKAFAAKARAAAAEAVARAAADAAKAAEQAAAEAEAIAAAEAAKVAEEAAAKAAAKEAAKVKKWQGKPAPAAPKKPEPPQVDGARFFDGWLAKVHARYDALGTAKKLDASFNYSYVRQVIESHDLAALDYLKANKYVDQALFDEAKGLFGKVADAKAAAEVDPAYLKALRSYRNLSTRHKRYLSEWREVNGVTAQLQGMDADAIRHASHEAGREWADRALPVPTAKQAAAITKYSGNDFGPWNEALRAHADGHTLPPGSWGKWTAQADEAFTPVPEDLFVHRGSTFMEFELPGGGRTHSMPPPDPRELIGTVQVQHGYMSTSVGHRSAFSSKPVQLVIRVPKGHKAAWVMPISQFETEYEALLQRSTFTFVHDVYQSDGKWVVELEVLPDGVDPESFKGLTPMPREAKPTVSYSAW
ncbi:ADP-ribosyltransferase [Micromonospora sp. WMMD980]|uniref:VG15 protein n=1 Tax=Micromonospora sp. WMMD980 TaxID=3016088 RepID=UPI002416042A|nr:ADP-ribosyltransferase [Micromonospora sp. WMMD980]MDG4801712.1 ADP-ribosyltransferase [Micromonospora sp. WMMD980]